MAKRSPKRLTEFIKIVGDEKAAALFEVHIGTARKYRTRERFPKPEVAAVIVERTRSHRSGPVTWAGIYAPHTWPANRL